MGKLNKILESIKKLKDKKDNQIIEAKIDLSRAVPEYMENVIKLIDENKEIPLPKSFSSTLNKAYKYKLDAYPNNDMFTKRIEIGIPQEESETLVRMGVRKDPIHFEFVELDNEEGDPSGNWGLDLGINVIRCESVKKDKASELSKRHPKDIDYNQNSDEYIQRDLETNCIEPLRLEIEAFEKFMEKPKDEQINIIRDFYAKQKEFMYNNK